MTNRIAVLVAVLVVGAIVADTLVFHWGATLFMLRKLFHFVEWLAFWR